MEKTELKEIDLGGIRIPEPTEEEMREAHENFLRMLRSNPNNFSYWFPHIKSLAEKGVSIPETMVITVPEEIFSSFFRERVGDDKRVEGWVREAVVPAISGNTALKGRKLFVKNGCYSGKFDFANCCLIENPDDLRKLVRNISNIQMDALTVDAYGYLELVVREYIEAPAVTPSIYNGMPLRPEVRLFYNFDKGEYLYAVNYWNWDYCHEAICTGGIRDERTPDADVYEKAYSRLEDDTSRFFLKHLPMIARALSNVTTLTMPDGMPNIWSVDFMLEEERAWLIDMAVGWRSAYWNPEKAKLTTKNSNDHEHSEKDAPQGGIHGVAGG